MDRNEYGMGMAGPQFCPFSEESSKGERWKIWLRNFNYYIDGQIGLSDKQKISRLLHQAGPEGQEIYETLKEDLSEGKDEYEMCVNRLNKYFEPELNTAYERQKFRNIVHIENESIDQFVLKLRKQSKYCNFKDSEEVIRDQLIEKCNNIEIKRKFLKRGNELTLSAALEIARLYDLEKQMYKEPESKLNIRDSEINKIFTNIRCYRCDRNGHIASDMSCPALSKTCDKCGGKGHYSKCCRSKLQKGSNLERSNQEVRKRKKRYVKYIIKDESDSESVNSDCEDDYSQCDNTMINSVYRVSGVTDNKCDIIISNITCKFIIDSGASVNIIDKGTYRLLISSGLHIELSKSKVKYYVYGGRELPNLGMFNVIMFCPITNMKVNCNVLVYDGKGPCLLSKDTSEKLNLLKVGPVMYLDNFDTKNIVNLYPKLFDGIGKLNNFKLKLHIDPNVCLVAQPTRRLPFNLRQIEKNLITELLDSDIIEPVSGPTPCVSPSHIVRKKEPGTYRLVVDMRRANEAVLREHVPLPTFEELLADLNGCKYFSAIDIKWGYHQIELEEESRMITVFNCSLGLYRYKRLFFGIRCAPEIFQRIVAQLLNGIEGVANSQDDIRIGGRTRQEHDERLKTVLDRLQQKGITLNKNKCVFGATEMTFLGHHLSAEGIKPTRSSKKVINEFRPPQCKKEVRSFLGLINFSARFIPNFSSISEPLRNLTKKDTNFVWQTSHQKAFQELKDAISAAPALGFYNKEATTYLITDASPVGIAAVLVQKQVVNNAMQPVVIKYVSRALTDTEKRYSQTEKEALAIVWVCENLYMYLMGKEFNIISDHKPLETIYSKRSYSPSARIQRWILRLQPFTFKVIYKPGKNNIADPLSRLLDVNFKATDKEDIEDSYLLALIDENKACAITLEEIKEETLKDEHLFSLKKAIEDDNWPKELKKYEIIKIELCEMDGVLLRGTRIIIPKSLIAKTLIIGHEGHLSASSMKAKLRRWVWWVSMEKDIDYWAETCEGCRLVRKALPPEPIVSSELPTKVWELVAIDFLGPLPSGHYLLVIIDYYSRYYEVEITKGPTAANTIQVLKVLIAREGVMDTIVCDNGPAFRDENFKTFLITHGITLRHTTPLWPQANGEVERQNRSILRRLRIAQGLKQNWKDELLTYLSAYRTTPHSATGVPPLFRGRTIKIKLPEILQKTLPEDESIRDKDRYKKLLTKEYADNRRQAKECNLDTGDTVLVRQAKENKLTTPFSSEKYKILWKKGNSIVAESGNGKIIKRNSSYFQQVKDRDLSKLGQEKRSVDTENAERKGETGQTDSGGKCIELSDTDLGNSNKDKTMDSTTKDSKTKTDSITSKQTISERPQRALRAPDKYKDYVMTLLLDCVSNNKSCDYNNKVCCNA